GRVPNPPPGTGAYSAPPAAQAPPAARPTTRAAGDGNPVSDNAVRSRPASCWPAPSAWPASRAIRARWPTTGLDPSPGDDQTAGMPSTLILLRHGESEWNRENRFTGWVDSDLSALGEEQARRAGEVLAESGLLPTIVHTSLQVRAIRTANLALDVMGRLWLPVRRSWRLNERHYGDLTGKDKKQTVAEFGEEQVALWRRSYDVPPPPITAGNPHNPNGHPAWAG